MCKMDSKESNPTSIDVNSTDFYEKLNDEIESDLARLKKCIEVTKYLRLSAAEMEVETAALYHAELWLNIIELEKLNESPLEDNEDTTSIENIN